MDMDGVLVDIDKGFKKLSGGFSPRNFKDAPMCGGDEKIARKKFWKLISSVPDFWVNLDPMPDAMVLWNYVKKKYTNPAPVVLSAGQGTGILNGKTQWIKTHIGQNITVILAPGGIKKPQFVIDQPNTRHILVDDTPKNIDAWNAAGENYLAILHRDAASSIRALNELDV